MSDPDLVSADFRRAPGGSVRPGELRPVIPRAVVSWAPRDRLCWANRTRDFPCTIRGRFIGSTGCCVWDVRTLNGSDANMKSWNVFLLHSLKRRFGLMDRLPKCIEHRRPFHTFEAILRVILACRRANKEMLKFARFGFFIGLVLMLSYTNWKEVNPEDGSCPHGTTLWSMFQSFVSVNWL